MPISRREFVYPGHPLVVATFILSKYGTHLKEAFVSTQHNIPAALGDNDIPGAGDCVCSALDLLHSVMEGEMTPVQAIESAKNKWTYERANCGHAEKLLPGEAQAREVETEFLELMQTACTPHGRC